VREPAIVSGRCRCRGVGDSGRLISVEDLVDAVVIHPDHLQVLVNGAPPLNVTLAEVGLRDPGTKTSVSEERRNRFTLATRAMVRPRVNSLSRDHRSASSRHRGSGPSRSLAIELPRQAREQSAMGMSTQRYGRWLVLVALTIWRVRYAQQPVTRTRAPASTTCIAPVLSFSQSMTSLTQ
jgi:hypothetical protein